MKYIIIILTAIAGILAILKEHKVLSKSERKRIDLFAWVIIVIIVVTTTITVWIQSDEDALAKKNQEFVDSTLVAQGETQQSQLRIQEETLGQITGGKTIPYVHFHSRVKIDPGEPTKWIVECTLYNPGPYPIDRLHVDLKERFKTPYKQDVTLFNNTLLVPLAPSPNDTFKDNRGRVFEGMNNIMIYSREIAQEDTALYFVATLTHRNDIVNQTTIYRRILEKPAVRGYFWSEATRLHSNSQKRDSFLIDPDFPNQPVDWSTGWENQ